MPPYFVEVTTLRVRYWLPPPQVTEQALHWLKLVTVQSMGQGCVLQLRTSLRSGHW